MTVIQPEDFNELEKQLTGSILQNGYSEKFEKFSRKISVVVYFILYYKQKHSTKNVFFAIFSNVLGHFRTSASEISQEISLNSFLFYKSSHLQELQQKILRNRVSVVY